MPSRWRRFGSTEDATVWTTWARSSSATGETGSCWYKPSCPFADGFYPRYRRVLSEIEWYDR